LTPTAAISALHLNPILEHLPSSEDQPMGTASCKSLQTQPPRPSNVDRLLRTPLKHSVDPADFQIFFAHDLFRLCALFLQLTEMARNARDLCGMESPLFLMVTAAEATSLCG